MYARLECFQVVVVDLLLVLPRRLTRLYDHLAVTFAVATARFWWNVSSQDCISCGLRMLV
jgi:hypothetical protein